jgi:hypothetical protein
MTTIEDGQKLRCKINRLPRRGDGKRVFSTRLKVAILVWVGHMKAEGATEAHCARLLGLTPCYFTAWRNARLASDAPVEFPLALRVEPLTRELVPIEVPPSIELTAGVVFVTPKGYRVEGLNLEQAFALLQEYV